MLPPDHIETRTGNGLHHHKVAMLLNI
jgi:hypothetical protein